jgi:FKBP-type peptidyl-prolyl cis-trans isomerase
MTYSPPKMRLRWMFAALLPFAIACLDTTAPDTATVAGTTFASSLNVDLASSTQLPSGVYYRDLIAGTGTTLAVGQSVTVYYNGWLADGTPFDSLKPPNNPLPFTIGSGQLIPGFDLGVRGMKVGGRRQLLIPPSMAYGRNGYLGIPGNAVVIFTVDAVSAQ